MAAKRPVSETGLREGTVMRVLVVEDERSISGFISQGFSEAGFVVTVEADGRRGLQRALNAEFDAIILDIMLPEMDGLEVLRRIRAAGSPTPVLLLTARDEIDDKVTGLDAGADDYLTKPFAFSELLARTRALMRRPPLQTDEVMRMGELELDQRRRTVRLGGHAISLSAREFGLLEYMLRHPGQVLSRTQIGEAVWGLDFENDSNVVDVYIGYLRRKLAIGGTEPAIRTVRGVGYVLADGAE
jgi:DNA-binding response OmpR family regulator